MGVQDYGRRELPHESLVRVDAMNAHVNRTSDKPNHLMGRPTQKTIPRSTFCVCSFVLMLTFSVRFYRCFCIEIPKRVPFEPALIPTEELTMHAIISRKEGQPDEVPNNPRGYRVTGQRNNPSKRRMMADSEAAKRKIKKGCSAHVRSKYGG